MEKDRGFVVFLDFQGPLCGYQEHQDFYNLISLRKNKKSKFYKKNKNETWYKVLSWFITINLVIIGLYIFSGEPYKLISHLLKK